MGCTWCEISARKLNEAAWKHAYGGADDEDGLRDRIEQLERELAAEKALADRLAKEADSVAYMERPHSLDDALTDYRKARGL